MDVNSVNFNTNNYNLVDISARNASQKPEADENLSENKKVFGYEVDKNGNFGADFNKAAGISEDVKIHSEALKSFVEQNTTSNNRFANFDSIELAKTIGNAYNSLSKDDKALDGTSKENAELLLNAINKNQSLVNGDVSHMGRLNGLDENMSPREFRLQIGLASAQYGNLLKASEEDLEKMPEFVKDLANFIQNLKSDKNETIKDPVESIYESLKSDDKSKFKELQESAAESIRKLNEDRSNIFAQQMFGLQGEQTSFSNTAFSTKGLEDFTSFFMKAQDFFNNTKNIEDQLDTTQIELKNAFLNLHRPHINVLV